MSRMIQVLLGVMVLTVAVQGASFGVRNDPAHDTIYFRSTAKLEFIEGKTNDLEGGFTFDSAAAQGIRGLLRVDLRTLKTGIDMRDEHMRERHLQTDQFPYAFFEFTSVTGLPQRPDGGKAYQVTAAGFFYIHGHKRKIEASGTALFHFDGSGKQSCDIRAKFSMNLDAYEIPRPKALLLKLAETIDVEVIFTASNELTAPSFSLPEWSELK
jgi:polyisoprenoid-binding protein YceI